MEDKAELLELICDNLHLLNNDELGEVASICMRSYQNKIVSESLKIKDPKQRMKMLENLESLGIVKIP